MQAGREIRVMVKPDRIDDIQAQVIARDIAKQVEEELTYPGQIRITVVRESRSTEFATEFHRKSYVKLFFPNGSAACVHHLQAA